MTPLPQPRKSSGMTDEQIRIFAEVAANPQRAINALPEKERRKYDEAQQSIMEARRYGQAQARNIFIR